MSTPAPALFRQQAALQQWLLHGDTAILAEVQGGDRRDDRLRIYANAYRLRLHEVLGNDFPVLRAWIGEAAFAALADEYLRAYPSRHPSVRHFGRHFAAWLQRCNTAPGQADLARFEWAQGEVFDAADAPVLAMDALARLPPTAWPVLRLRLLPALRLLRLPSAVPARIVAHGEGRPLQTAYTGDDIGDWLLWRRGLQIHWRRLETDEAELLALAQAGATFPRLCARLAGDLPEAEAALRAAGLLKRWFADGLVAAIEPAGEPTTSDSITSD